MADETFSIDDLVEIPNGQLSEEDKLKYDGSKTKIAKASVEPKDSVFKNGQRLPEGQTVKTVVAILETESIGINLLGQPIIVREEFSLKQHPVSKKWGPSMHEKSKSRKLFNKFKVNNFKDCIGKDILVIRKVSETNANKTWLGFSI